MLLARDVRDEGQSRRHHRGRSHAFDRPEEHEQPRILGQGEQQHRHRVEGSTRHEHRLGTTRSLSRPAGTENTRTADVVRAGHKADHAERSPCVLALKLYKAKVRILGTSPLSIDKCEDRYKFSSILDKLQIKQPVWQELSSVERAKDFSNEIGYPVLLRPSYVLSGTAMKVCHTDEELYEYLKRNVHISKEHKVVISKFEEGAKEIELDGVAQDGNLIIYAITEHIENAGVHSGDATLVIPPQKLYFETVHQIKRITKAV